MRIFIDLGEDNTFAAYATYIGEKAGLPLDLLFTAEGVSELADKVATWGNHALEHKKDMEKLMEAKDGTE